MRAENCAPQPPTTSRARRRRALIKDPFLAPQGESAGFAFTKDEMLEIFKAKTDAFKAADYEESGFTHAAYTFGYESYIAKTSIAQGTELPPGALISRRLLVPNPTTLLGRLT